MKVLITGANGQLGWALQQYPHDQQFNVIALNRKQLDITNKAALIDAVTTIKPDIFINTAAYLNTDNAQTQRDLAYLTNTEAPTTIAELCAQQQIPLIHFSSDYVFNGHQTQPYQETDPVDPLNVYGQTKVLGEIKIRELLPQHIIIRVSSIFGVHGNNFVKAILKLAQQKDTLRVVVDQTMCPTPVTALAKIVMVIVNRIRTDPTAISWGTYHYCGDNSISWHAYAEKIVTLASSHYPLTARNIIAINAEEYPSPALRPAYSVLNCDKIYNNFAIQQPNWLQALTDLLSKRTIPDV